MQALPKITPHSPDTKKCVCVWQQLLSSRSWLHWQAAFVCAGSTAGFADLGLMGKCSITQCLLFLLLLDVRQFCKVHSCLLWCRISWACVNVFFLFFFFTLFLFVSTAYFPLIFFSFVFYCWLILIKSTKVIRKWKELSNKWYGGGGGHEYG